MSNFETHTLIKSIVDSMDSNIAVTSIVQIGVTNRYLISTSNTKWIGLNRNYTIDSDIYKVVDVDANTSFTIELETGQVAPVTTSINIGVPFFFHGTFISQNNELTQIQFAKDKTPFIYFNEPSTDQFYDDELDARDRDSGVDLYFMTEANFEDWTNEQHYDYAIIATSNMVKSFIQAAKNINFVSEVLKHSSENHVKWGTVSLGGHARKLFNDNLSGKKVDVTLTFLKQGCNFEPFEPNDGSIDLIINVDGVEYFNEEITEDTTVNIVYT